MSNIVALNDQKFQLRSKRKNKKYGELILYSAIGEDMWGDGISAVSVNDAFKQFGDIEALDIRINSPGGNVFDGVTIYNRIKQIQVPTTVYIDGLAASIASVIAMAGDEIIASEGSMMMIHSPMTMTFGNAQDHENSIDILDTIESEMIGIYARRTDMPRSRIQEMLKKETWMTSEEMIEMNFATSIDSELEVAASSKKAIDYFAKHYKNMPKDKIVTDSKVVKNRINEIRNNMQRYLAR